MHAYLDNRCGARVSLLPSRGPLGVAPLVA
jgi:hypothetical protein